MVVDLQFNKKGLFTVEAFVSLSITLLLVGLLTSIIQANYAHHTVFKRKIREMEESLLDAMNDIEGCLQACQIEEDSHSSKS